MNLQMGLARAYDFLFDYITGNQDLAAAVGRYIPWIKTDEDLRRLIETRILQYGAKQSRHFQLSNSKAHSVCLLHTAVIQQDPDATRPWMDALWRETHVYPHPNAGLPDYISTATQRDGTTDIGSVSYTHGGSPFLRTVAMTRRYVANGGDAKFDLSDFDLYGKMPVGCMFPLDSCVAGGFPMTIGDVGNPAKPRIFEALKNFEQQFRIAFEWTADPRAAWIVKHYFGRRNESDTRWAALESAAASHKRNPFLEQSSRVMANWAGILETGRESDDFRFKRVAYLRVGSGHGHGHHDALDLQIQAHGSRAANDLGHRGSYSMPKAPRAIVHNRVLFNSIRHPRDSDWNGCSWIRTFKPLEGAQFMRGCAIPAYQRQHPVKSFVRDVALIDVDGGRPSPGTPYEGLYRGGRTKHATDVTTPNSYVFDVQRVDGGIWHTWAFHGCWSEDFHVNLTNRVEVGQSTHDKTPADDSPDARYLMKFLDGPGLKYAGDVAEHGLVVATWRLRRTKETINGFLPHRGEPRSCEQGNAEQMMLGVDFDPSSPPRFTRAHLPSRDGERILVGMPSPVGPEHAEQSWPFLMVQQRNEKPSQSVYASIIEPYVGEPFIERVAMVDSVDSDERASRAIALQVDTTNGRRDLLFSDGAADGVREVAGGVRIKADFAYLSRDSAGVRLAELVGGTELVAPDLEIRVDAPAHEGRITDVNYLKRYIRVDAALPVGRLLGELFEVGNKEHKTMFTIVDARREGEATTITFDKPADLSYSTIVRVDARARQIFTKIGPAIRLPGMTKGLTCTPEGLGQSWPCDMLGPRRGIGFGYQLHRAFTEEDFPVGMTFRLWEFGIGDTIHIPTHARIVRREDGEFTITGNVRGVVAVGDRAFTIAE